MITRFYNEKNENGDRHREDLSTARSDSHEQIMIISGRTAMANLLATRLTGKGYGILSVSPLADFQCFGTGCPSVILIDCQGNCGAIREHLRASWRIPVICLDDRVCTPKLHGFEYFHMDGLSTESEQIEALTNKIQCALGIKAKVSADPGHYFVEYHMNERLLPPSLLSLKRTGITIAAAEQKKLIEPSESGHKPNGAANVDVISLLIVSERKEEQLRGILLPQSNLGANFSLVVNRIVRPEQIADCLEQLQPNVLLLDTALPYPPLAQWLRMIRDEAPTLKVILLSDDSLLDWVNEIVEFGVSGCVLIDAQPQMLIKAIRAVNEGELWLPRYVLVRVFKEMLSRYAGSGASFDREASGIAENVARLTRQEKRIAELVAQGLTNKEIARQFAGSPETIKKHLQKIFEKLGINRRSQLATLQANERFLTRKELTTNKTIAA